MIHMDPKTASLPLNRRRVFRSGLCAALLLSAGTVPYRAQSQPAPELQLTIVSQRGSAGPPSTSTITAAQGWEFTMDARITDAPYLAGIVPLVLTITSALPGGTTETIDNPQVATSTTAAAPGYYDVVARASTADWLAQKTADGDLGTVNWFLTTASPGDWVEMSVTQRVAVVGITSVTPTTYHAAVGTTNTFTAALTPENAFEWVWWDWYPGLG